MEVDVQVVPEGALLRARAWASSVSVRRVVAVVALALAYYGSAKLGQTLRYTASVSAIWPPAGLGIAALYLWGLRLWPGIFIGEVLVNAELLATDNPLPLWSVVGQQTGNMLEVVVGAILLRRLVGPRTGLDRPADVVGMLLALGCATAISATSGTLSMLATNVIEPAQAAEFFRTWWLGDTTGGLVVMPLVLVWAHDPAGSWRRVRTLEGGLVFLSLAALSVLSVVADEPVAYLVFPALVWAALRFGPPGASLAIVVVAGAAIGFTANEMGAFFRHPIDQGTLSTQLYIGVAALTALAVGALVGERDRSSAELYEARRSEGERALEERHRIARGLHDSVSQALFSIVLHTRTAQRGLAGHGESVPQVAADELGVIAELTSSAQREMRGLLHELNGTGASESLLTGLNRHVATLARPGGLAVFVSGPEDGLGLSPQAETELLAIGREALANVVKHSLASHAWVRVEVEDGHVSLEIRDDGQGFDAVSAHPGHYGLESMRTRAEEVHAALTVETRPGEGTVVRVEVAKDEP